MTIEELEEILEDEMKILTEIVHMESEGKLGCASKFARTKINEYLGKKIKKLKEQESDKVDTWRRKKKEIQMWMKRIYCFEPDEYELIHHDNTGKWGIRMEEQETELEKIDGMWMLCEE